MDKITVICAVAAEFIDGDKKFAIKSRDRNLILEAPAWIQNTNTFKWMASDGTLKFVLPTNKVQLENAPTLGMNAEGKAVVAEEKAEDTAEKPQNGRKQTGRRKNAQKAEEEPEGGTDAK